MKAKIYSAAFEIIVFLVEKIFLNACKISKRFLCFTLPETFHSLGPNKKQGNLFFIVQVAYRK